MQNEYSTLLARTKKNFGKAFRQLFGDLASVLYVTFVQFPRDCKTFVSNVLSYRKLLWKDRDWDHSYILEFLLFKIRRTREHIAKHRHHTTWQRDVTNMQKVEDLIQSNLSESHLSELYEAHNKKWGPPKMVFVKIPGSNCSSMRTLRPFARTPEEQAQENSEYLKLMKLNNKKEQVMWSKLWKLLDKHMREWWD